MFKMRALNLLILYIVFGISSSSSSESIVEDVFISLYTNEKPYDPIHLTKNSNLKDYPEVNPSNPWKFFIHGWTTSPSTSPWYKTHKDNYFKDGSYNVVYVDWSKPGNQSYIQSVINAKGCGKVFAELILNLAQNNCVELKNIHLISHSLGSQMAAFAAKEIYSVLREKIGRHTAHDPARPLFETPWLLPENLRLSKNDAEFVDVIHTDSGNYGMITAIGHVDFYPNGGKRFQPGCENDDDINCSHARSTKFYGESIIYNKKLAVNCNSYENFLDNKCNNDKYIIFGEKVDQSARGVYYFCTKSQPPYLV